MKYSLSASALAAALILPLSGAVLAQDNPMVWDCTRASSSGGACGWPAGAAWAGAAAVAAGAAAKRPPAC